MKKILLSLTLLLSATAGAANGGRSGVGGAGHIVTAQVMTIGRIIVNSFGSYADYYHNLRLGQRLHHTQQNALSDLVFGVNEDGAKLVVLVKPKLCARFYHSGVVELVLEKEDNCAGQDDVSSYHEVDAFNQPQYSTVYISKSRWVTLSTAERVLLVAHELLSLVGVQDKDYQASTPILNLIVSKPRLLEEIAAFPQ